MSDLDDGSVEPNKMLHGQAIAQRHQKPRKNIAGGNIREQSVILDHGNGVDCKDKPKGLVRLGAKLNVWEGVGLSHWCSSVALEAMAMNEFVRTVMRIVLGTRQFAWGPRVILQFWNTLTRPRSDK